MQIYIVGITGKKITINADESDTVEMVKQKIFEHPESGLPIEMQRLIFEGKQLENYKTLTEYNIQDESLIRIVSRIRGC